MSIPLRGLPVAQRPRERLAELGPDALSDAELLALLLGHGFRGENVLDVATGMLATHGGVAGVAAARPEELARSAGIGAAKAATVIAAFQLGARARSRPEPAAPLRCTEDVMHAASPMFAGSRVERLLVLVCDTKNRLRQRVFVAQGAIDEVAVPVREVLNTVLRHDGRAFAVAHNHPSGDPVPSADDWRASTILAAAARTVGVRFLDHVVIAGEQWRSAMPAVSARAMFE